MAIVLQIIINALLTASFYALIGSGLSFLYATSRIFHLAHGAVTIAAGYIFWWMTEYMGFHPIVGVLASLCAAASLGYISDEYVYEVLRKKGARGLSNLLATLAMLILCTAIILLLFGAAPKTFSFQTKVLSLGDIVITQFQLFILLVSIILLAIFYWITQYTRFGKAMRATADNEIMAEVLGINTRKIRRWSFILSSLLAAPAGIMIGLEFSLDPNAGIILAVFGFSAMVIGGVGSFMGAILGACILGFSEQIAVWFGGGGWKYALSFILLFLFLLFRPQGILGNKER